MCNFFHLIVNGLININFLKKNRVKGGLLSNLKNEWLRLILAMYVNICYVNELK
jgi:hypothetical protein